MQENTNRVIFINSIINYIKMGINTVLALLTTRYALIALGVNDFGLFSLLGSIISFIGIFNTIMLSTSNRFLAVAIGKGNRENINKQFNINLTIFLCIALLMLVVSYPIGDWYIRTYVNYNGPIECAIRVFCISIIGSVLSTIAIPYHGLLMAKEKFIVFSSVEVLVHFIRFTVAYVLVNHFTDKLIIYTVTMAAMAALPSLIFWIYCRRKYFDYVKWNFISDIKAYRDIFSFSSWVAYGACAVIARNQGAALLVNMFFNTVMNTALGLANSLISYVTMFASNLTQPMQPQITKSYVQGNEKRTDELLVMSTKYSFLLMFLIGSPFFIDANYIINLWLEDIPQYITTIIILLLIDNLTQSFNSGISTILFASGKIALYQIVINTLRVMSIVVAYFVLKLELWTYGLFYVYIAFSFICLFATQWCLKKTLNYNVNKIIKESYIPSLAIVVLFIPCLFLPNSLHSLLKMIISFIYLIILEWFLGLSSKERMLITVKVKGLFKNKV